ncbi:Zn-dependent hydrolase [Natrarchaeobius oligotrophus]|uniref:Zn-dependent hydrolase n=1 Tax=Natrarchaeobius chitinivorans TaxID=1679083 RepID=A0A3N6N1I1_NATCH|nr:Zn-dependent hydrolase [Natrarchaeobius chitinivorans]RQH02682.1 Zn-dependent hydrolase [Natrarchaeobius chitinivorans]
MSVDRDRLRADIEANAEFGTVESDAGRGRTVLTGSEADGQARERLVDRLEAAGLEVRVDPVGNVAGRWVPDGVSPDVAPIALGSHLDSVPRGGIFDGPLGVYAALEAVRAIQESATTPERPLEVVSFTEEEGAQFGVGTLGSSVAADRLSVEEAHALTNDAGETLEERLEGIGFVGSDEVDPSTWNAWLEVHVEQDTKLESAGIPIGVVNSISGITNCTATVSGEANHAGATSMADRRDALTAASEFVVDVERIAKGVTDDHPTAVATVGRQDVEPNVRNIVPGRVRMEMDVRSVEADAIDAIVERSAERLERLESERPVETSFDRHRDSPPVHLSDRCVDAIGRATDRLDVEATTMHSAAIHDTGNVAAMTDAAMLFAPSRDGVSHSPLEWTDWDDCATSAAVLGAAALELA